MRAFYDLETETLTAQLGTRQALAELVFKRGSNASLEVQFFRGAEAVELDPDATGIFGMKELGKYDADYVTAGLSWVKTGTGADALYVFSFSFINAFLDDLFNVDADLTNDVVTVTLMGELQWISGGIRHKTQTLNVKIANDVNRGGESVPMPPGVAYGVFLINITRLVGGTAIDLDNVPTVNLGVGYVAMVLIGTTTPQWMVFVLKTGSAATAADVQPLDHDDDTNDKYWKGASAAGAPPAVEVAEEEFVVATDGQTEYPLSGSASSVLAVGINGLIQPRSEYSMVVNTLTFDDGIGITAGDTISISYLT